LQVTTVTSCILRKKGAYLSSESNGRNVAKWRRKGRALAGSFFRTQLALELRAKEKTADLIIGNNVLAAGAGHQ